MRKLPSSVAPQQLVLGDHIAQIADFRVARGKMIVPEQREPLLERKWRLQNPQQPPGSELDFVVVIERCRHVGHLLVEGLPGDERTTAKERADGRIGPDGERLFKLRDFRSEAGAAIKMASLGEIPRMFVAGPVRFPGPLRSRASWVTSCTRSLKARSKRRDPKIDVVLIRPDPVARFDPAQMVEQIQHQ